MDDLVNYMRSLNPKDSERVLELIQKHNGHE